MGSCILKHFRIVVVAIVILFSEPSQAMRVLTSIKPIQLISYELMSGVAIPEVLLGPNTSPHDYALRPSDVKRIHRADLVVWFGPGLEPFLAKMLSHRENVLTISRIPGIRFRHFSETHQDDGHHHGTLNPHFWLGIDVVKQVAKGISTALIRLDPGHTGQYRQNLEKFLSRLQQTDQQIRQQLSAVHQRPYYVFHDAYDYFEAYYHMNNIGHFTVSPERKPGAKTLIRIRQTLKQQSGVCIFSEPQFSPAVIDAVTRGTNAKKGVLDPLATDIPVGPGSYFTFLQTLSDHFIECLSQ
jgi:zinc transport system substrate-binding protein